jgi:predicted GH43/DUF377 family glycosyl hydrolase
MKSYFTTFILLMFFIASIFTASFAQTDWEKYLDNPVLEQGPSGAWDDGSVAKPSILFEGNTYHMWYTGRSTIQRIGYAFSPDGISWTKYDDPTTTSPSFVESDPVLNPGQPGAWDEKQATAPSVLLLDTTYHMWYRGKDNTSSSTGPGSIGHAISNDGINWEKDIPNNPILTPGTSGSWDAVWIGYPSVVFDGSIYHMWYSAWGGVEEVEVRIGHATSLHPDSTWTKDPNNPVLRFGGVGSWDYPRIDFPSVIYNGNTFHMWYSGGDHFAWRIGYATSPDGSEWTKYAGNPVLDWGLAGSWDDTFVGGCSVIDSAASIYKMWYSGGIGVWDGHIGYATAPFDTSDTTAISVLNENQPNNYVLQQNYPNPFNPSTTIEFTLPKSEYVELKVYNILGKTVATLVSNKLIQGNHSYQFDGKNLGSGIYYYQLIAGDYREVKKMILIK